LTELNIKIEKPEERFINFERAKEVLGKYKFKYEVEKAELAEKLKKLIFEFKTENDLRKNHGNCLKSL
jgi:hypothetical protein